MLLFFISSSFFLIKFLSFSFLLIILFTLFLISFFSLIWLIFFRLWEFLLKYRVFSNFWLFNCFFIGNKLLATLLKFLISSLFEPNKKLFGLTLLLLLFKNNSNKSVWFPFFDKDKVLLLSLLHSLLLIKNLFILVFPNNLTGVLEKSLFLFACFRNFCFDFWFLLFLATDFTLWFSFSLYFNNVISLLFL